MSMVNVQNLGFGGSGIPDALPKAVAELQGLKLEVINGATAGTLMPVAGMDPEDHIGAVVDLTAMASVDPATCTIGGRNASATITCLTTAVDGDKVTINGKSYTFKDVIVHTSYNAPPGVIPTDITPSGSNPTDMAAKLAKAIMSGDSTLTATAVGAVVTVKVRAPGTAGNAYTLTETGTAVNVSGATFTGGTAAASAGFTSTVNLATKKILLLWYDKRPGQATAPLLARGKDEEDEEGLSVGEKLKAMRFRGGKEETDEERGRREEEEEKARREEEARMEAEKNKGKKPGPR